MLSCESVLKQILIRHVKEFIFDRMVLSKSVSILNVTIESPTIDNYGGSLPFTVYIKINDGAVVDKYYLTGDFNVQGFILIRKLYKNNVEMENHNSWNF
jgi:hypothetical protein